MILYRNKNSDRFVELVENTYLDRGSDECLVVIYKCHSGHAVMLADTFHSIYEPVIYSCGVDLYAILHGPLGRQDAREYAERIEIALAKADQT